MSDADRQRPIKDAHIIMIAHEASSEWLRIARLLPNALCPGEVAFKLGTPTLDKIQKESSDDEERLIQALVKWRAMSPHHTWGPLWDTLHQCRRGSVAFKLLKTSPQGKIASIIAGQSRRR